MKVIKKHIKEAILIYFDPDEKCRRRVIFGESNKILKMFIDEATYLMPRLQEMAKRNSQNLEDIKKNIEETRQDCERDNYCTVSENLELDLSYEVKKV